MIQNQPRNRTLRAFTGLVGRYEPEPTPPVANPPRPGQPRKHADNAAKQRAYRIRCSDPECRSLIAQILRKSRSTEASSEYLRRLHAELMLLPVSDLQNTLEVLKQNLDAKGRLHNERSGERKRLHGMSEIERLVAGKEQREHGSRVSIKNPSILRAPQRDPLLDAAIRDVLNEMATDRKCPWCDSPFDVRAAAENHLHEEYDRGKRQADHVKALRDYELVPIELLEEAERRLAEHTHYEGINDRATRLRKRHAKWQREGKRELDRSGTYVAWDLRTW